MSYNSKYKGTEVDALLDKVNSGIPLATASVNGGIKIGYTLNGKNYPIALDENGKAYVNVPWSDLDTKYDVATQTSNGLMSSVDKKKLDGLSNYTLPTTASATLGGIKVGYANNGKNYKIQVDASGNAFVNVPWTDTTYGKATTSTAGLMSSTDKAKMDMLQSYTTATSVASINANYQKVKVTLSSNGTLSMSATGASMNGRSVTAYILASGANRTVTIPTSGSYISMCGSSLTIPSGKWAELNMECIDGIWHIAKLEQE